MAQAVEMIDSDPTLPLRFCPSLKQRWPLVLGSALFTFGAIAFAFFSDEDPLIKWSCIAGSGILALVCAAHLPPSSIRLELTENGFTFRTAFVSRFVRWNAVEVFFESFDLNGNGRVGWNYRGDSGTRSAIRVWSEALDGAEGRLPHDFGVNRVVLLKLLNDLLSEYGTSDDRIAQGTEEEKPPEQKGFFAKLFAISDDLIQRDSKPTIKSVCDNFKNYAVLLSVIGVQYVIAKWLYSIALSRTGLTQGLTIPACAILASMVLTIFFVLINLRHTFEITAQVAIVFSNHFGANKGRPSQLLGLAILGYVLAVLVSIAIGMVDLVQKISIHP